MSPLLTATFNNNLSILIDYLMKKEDAEVERKAVIECLFYNNTLEIENRELRMMQEVSYRPFRKQVLELEARLKKAEREYRKLREQNKALIKQLENDKRTIK